MGVKDVRPKDFIHELADKLEEEMEMPPWAKFVKTGSGRERAPTQDNWWFIRSASILRKIYTKGPIGVEKLRSEYGKKKSKTHKPGHSSKASGAIIRRILQKLEDLGYVEKKNNEGRILTPEGKSFLDGLANEMKAAKPQA